MAEENKIEENPLKETNDNDSDINIKIDADIKENDNAADINSETKSNQQTKENEEHVFAVPSIPFSKTEKVEKAEIKSSVNEKNKTQSGFSLVEPEWGGVDESLDQPYSLMILKEGIVKDTVDISKKSRYVFGRNHDCDVQIEHPSCSRYHAVLQYCVIEKEMRKKGFYIYDTGSTHGTYLNKVKVKPKVYNRVRVGYQLKFGGSTRLYIVEGPMEDQEEELDMDKMKEKKRLYQQHLEEEKRRRAKNTNTMILKSSSSQKKNGGGGVVGDDDNNDDDGASWGFGDDAQEEGINLKDLFEKKQDFEIKDPKKTLNGFFEREGLEFEYEMSEKGSGKSATHVAKVRLPFDTDDGEEVIAEGCSSNKKDAVLACATEACRLIQTYDMMTNKTREDQRKIRQRELEANDYYDSDEDSFLDRTGNLEKKRLARKKRAGKQEKEVVETHETLKVKLQQKQNELKPLETKLQRSKAAQLQEESSEKDSLDSFMSSMSDRLDKTTESKIKRQVADLKKEVQQLEKMVEKTRPALLPALNAMKPNQPVHKKKKPEPREMHQTKNNSSEERSIKLATMSTAQILKSQPQSKREKKDVKEEDLTENSNAKSPQKKEPPTKKVRKVYGAPTKPVYKAEKECVDWTPPEGQTGDGRTSLNDKLGY